MEDGKGKKNPMNRVKILKQVQDDSLHDFIYSAKSQTTASAILIRSSGLILSCNPR